MVSFLLLQLTGSLSVKIVCHELSMVRHVVHCSMLFTMSGSSRAWGWAPSILGGIVEGLEPLKRECGCNFRSRIESCRICSCLGIPLEDHYLTVPMES